jgi:hypothetical protein
MAIVILQKAWLAGNRPFASFPFRSPMLCFQLLSRRVKPDDPDLDPDLSALRPSLDRNHADRRLPVLLRVHGLPRLAQAAAGELLRVLLLWRRALPAGPGSAPCGWRGRMLRKKP